MKAIVKTKPEPGVELLDVDVPQVGETDILIKVSAGSLCGSDIHYYEWLPGSQFIRVPVILGHEFSGQVVEVGSLVENVQVGDRVSAMPSMPCCQCSNCRAGRGDSCSNRLVPGLLSDGFFAEYGRLTAGANIFKLPENVSYEAAALLEPFSVALNAVDLSDLKIGQKAAVLGPGPIGLFTLQILKAGGASLIMMAGTGADEKRLDLAEELGADVIVDVEKDDPAFKTLELTGQGLDMVFEATGNPKSVAQGLNMVKPGGKVVLIGIHPGLAEFDPTPMVRGRKTLIGAYAYDAQTWERALAVISSGQVNPEAVITHRLPLSQAEKGFQMAINKEAVKVLFMP
ncbi:MAG: alcohol dehydrogenase catalytic domain-containing protein [Deltaproteobacteria bacterium]|nr:alcohol dehydrogenase catalytic domain-containing protein [Deltaproteobacteria bacterium]MBW2050935.1 alcohol dehydrogenase catalytic domain-containing protein [Deltaproteobacteria bacterium]MBW2141538.1 alcohol dehydrogenase catalytic domain-containing protein [Deltaproteobacteria bacterium]MBW2323422.1 alcohol dehydrogenase catalytic domain-containing protein [Deltaproteobacteria bacterium]